MQNTVHISAEAQEVIAQLLKYVYPQGADALLLLGDRIAFVRGLPNILSQSDKYIAVPVHKDHLPKQLYSDVVYLRPFADVAGAIRAPFGVDTVYQIKPRPERPRTGAYRLPAPAPTRLHSAPANR